MQTRFCRFDSRHLQESSGDTVRAVGNGERGGISFVAPGIETAALRAGSLASMPHMPQSVTASRFRTLKTSTQHIKPTTDFNPHGRRVSPQGTTES
jgi:hypothetical protein